MTIAIGFSCKDGIVLASDTEYTLGTVKVWGEKIFEVKTDHRQCRMVVAGAGDVPYIKAAVDMLDKQMAAIPVGEEVHLDQLQNTVGEVIKELYTQFIFPHPHEPPNWPRPSVNLLVGCWSSVADDSLLPSSGELRLLATESDVVYPVRTYEPLGSGIDLVSFLAEPFRMLYGNATTDAARLATYLVMAAKKSVPYCGGDTPIAILDLKGKIKRLDSRAKQEEDWMSDAQEDFAFLFLPAMNLDFDDETIDFLIGELKETIHMRRQQERTRIAKRNQIAEKIAKRKRAKTNAPHPSS